jgi:hypothetical protein
VCWVGHDGDEEVLEFVEVVVCVEFVQLLYCCYLKQMFVKRGIIEVVDNNSVLPWC